MKTPIQRLGLALALLLPAAALATSPDPSPLPDVAAHEAQLRYFLAVAESDGDALSDAFLANALGAMRDNAIRAGTTDRGLLARAEVVRDELAARAEAARGSDATLLATQLRCLPVRHAEPRCEADLRRLAELAGGNGYHHVLLMGYAWARGDAAEVLQQARLAAEAPDYRHDFPLVFASLRQRLSSVPAPGRAAADASGEARVADVHAMAMAAAVALPAYQPFVASCRDAGDELRDHCLAIAERMLAEGQVALDVGVASAVIEALGDPARQAEARAIVRRMNWHSTAMGRAEREFSQAQFGEYFRRVSTEGEVAALAYAAAELGLPAEPPADWRYPGEPAAAP